MTIDDLETLGKVIDLMRTKGVTQLAVDNVTIVLGQKPNEPANPREWTEFVERWEKGGGDNGEPNHLPLPRIKRGPPQPDEVPMHFSR